MHTLKSLTLLVNHRPVIIILQIVLLARIPRAYDLTLVTQPQFHINFLSNISLTS